MVKKDTFYTNVSDKKGGKKGEKKREVEIMAVSMSSTPVIKGQAAKDLLREIKNPTSKKDLFDKCKQLGSVFKEK